jgi:hypothetical protein
MAAKQSMKPLTTAKKTTATSKKSVATKATETVRAAAVKAAKTSTPRKTKAAAVKVAKTPTPRKTKAPAVKAAKTPRSKAVSSNSPELNSNKGQDLLQQAIQTQAWMTNEITQLRQQLAKSNHSQPSSSQNSEIERLQQENAELREKASRLDQMTSLLQGQSTAGRATKAVKKTVQKTNPKISTPRKTKAPKATPVAKVVTKKVAAKSVSPAPTARKTRSGVSILQDAAAKDVNRTYKSCWPIVFKIEEWNQKHPGQLAKVSQTMLNKSGVNFSRAKGFMDNYGDLVESYHQQIGLSKANSGKFNEVYEFIRSALGKGKKV